MIKKIISTPYQLAHLIRESLFNLKCKLGFSKKNTLARPVISIGNISFGGTGKTPFCYELVKYLSLQGLKVGILSRGYKSNFEQSCAFFSSLNHKYSAKDIGDEPLMLANKFKDTNLEVFFAIGKDRYTNAQALIDLESEIDVLVLDDGLQYFKLKRDIEIILENVQEQGFYREFDFALKKADFLIYTKADDDWMSKNLEKNSMKFNLVLTKKLHYETDVGVFTGIADYITLTKMLKRHINQEFQRNDAQVKVLNYPDHHFFNLQEISDAINLGIELITTEKDWVKIPEEFHSYFNLVKVEQEFQPKDLMAKIFSVITKRGQ
jgi:tetraacyldisaccharide 4'-kinase